MSTCIHCARTITATPTGWADMGATGDDKIWKYICDKNDEDFQALHETDYSTFNKQETPLWRRK